MSQSSLDIRNAGMSDVGGLFAVTARLNSDRIALVDGERQLSYGQLNARVNRLADVMARRGVGRGDRIALLARNCCAYLEVELAAAKLGAISVNINWRFTPDELRHGLELTSPAMIVVGPAYGESLAGIGWKPDLVIGPEYEAAIAGGEEKEPARSVDVEDGLVIIFTSGTTGLPKGALISHRAMIARAMIYAAETQAPAEDTFVAWSPLFHMGANDFALITLLRGGRVVVIDGYRAEDIIRAIEVWPVHYLTLIPGMIEDFIGELKRLDATPRAIGMIGALADLVPRPLLGQVTRLLNAPYFNTFGSTETGIPPASGNFVPIGEAPEELPKKQNGFCEIRLVDPEDKEVTLGQPGELAIRGPSLFSGYWANDDANREAFRGGWFHMGDAFRRRPDGLLDFVDRVKYMIKSGGENIYPAEIERHIMADPRIVDVAVVRKPDLRWGEVPVAFAVRTDESLTADGVVGLCRGRIANYKLPKEVHFVASETLPRSASGKIRRHVLEDRLK